MSFGAIRIPIRNVVCEIPTLPRNVSMVSIWMCIEIKNASLNLQCQRHFYFLSKIPECEVNKLARYVPLYTHTYIFFIHITVADT